MTDQDQDQDSDDAPVLVALGANQRGAPSAVNLDVSGTVGPDHLGQETVDVDGNPNDRPGVQSRLPENRPDDPRISRMDTGEELPVLLSSSMRAGVTEGVQGSYTKIVEGECVRCGYDRLTVSVVTLPGEHRETCNACGAIQDGRAEDNYRMPTTDEARAERERDSGDHLTEISPGEVMDLETSTGAGPYISIVATRSVTRLHKDDVPDLFFALAENDDISIHSEIQDNLKRQEVFLLAASLLPDNVSLTDESDGDGDGDDAEGGE